MIVQDADKLDAMGAIGVARAFSYSGFKKRSFYEPGIKPVLHASKQEYRKNKSNTINHFYEKLLLLKDLMHTKTAKSMAQKRHDFMLQFLDNFFAEWGE